jgi:hypothetical protein
MKIIQKFKIIQNILTINIFNKELLFINIFIWLILFNLLRLIIL